MESNGIEEDKPQKLYLAQRVGMFLAGMMLFSVMAGAVAVQSTFAALAAGMIMLILAGGAMLHFTNVLQALEEEVLLARAG